MPETAEATVSRLIEVLAGRAPISQAQDLVADDVVSHMDGFTFRGIGTWAKWLSYVRAHSLVGPPDLVTDRLVTEADGAVTAYGRWMGTRDGQPALSDEVWACYRVVDGKVVEIWTHKENYVFLLGPLMRSAAGLIVVMLRVFFSRPPSAGEALASPPNDVSGAS